MCVGGRRVSISGTDLVVPVVEQGLGQLAGLEEYFVRRLHYYQVHHQICNLDPLTLFSICVGTSWMVFLNLPTAPARFSLHCTSKRLMTLSGRSSLSNMHSELLVLVLVAIIIGSPFSTAPLQPSAEPPSALRTDSVEVFLELLDANDGNPTPWLPPAPCTACWPK